jgi:hypothetical protein
MHKRKLNVGSVIGTIILGGLMIALMIYTATRTVDFLQMTFPKSMSYVAYLALAAFDGGIIGWTIFATSAAEGSMQRGLAYLMIFVDTAGVILTTVADTTTISAQNGLTKLDPNMVTVGMWGSIAIIVLNVVAIIVTHLVSPSHVRKFELENVHDDIHQLTMQHIRSRAIEIAPRIAAEHADHWVRTTIQDVVGSLPASSQTRQLETPRVVDSNPPAISHRQVAAPAIAAHRERFVDPHQVKPEVDKETKSLGEKKGFRAWVDKKVFKVEEDGQNGELVSPVNYDRRPNRDLFEEKAGIPPQKVVEDKNPKLPLDPKKWTKKHWMIAKETLPEDQYNELFDAYLGDSPSEEDVREENENPR